MGGLGWGWIDDRVDGRCHAASDEAVGDAAAGGAAGAVIAKAGVGRVSEVSRHKVGVAVAVRIW